MKSILKYCIIACLPFVLAGFSSCAGSSSDAQRHDNRTRVAVTIAPQQWIISQIADSDFMVDVMLPPGYDPESSEISMATLKNLSRDSIWFLTGTLSFEQAHASSILRANPQLKSTTLTHNTHLHHHHDAHGHHNHHDADPHVWTSPTVLREWTDAILPHLVALNPSKRDVYVNNSRKLKKRIDMVADSIAMLLSKAAGSTFVIWHPSLTHWAEDAGVHQIAIETEGKETSPRAMADALSEAKKRNACIFVIEKEHNPDMTKALNADMGLREMEISLMQGDVLTTLLKLAQELSAAHPQE